MSDKGGGNVLAQTASEEHNHAASAKRVVLRGFDGSTYPDISTEDYAGGAKSALAVASGPANSVTAEFYEVGTSTIAGPAASTSREKIFFLADKDNTDSVFVLIASTTTHQLGIELEAGDAFGDSPPYAYEGAYWFKGGAASQGVTVRQWFS